MIYGIELSIGCILLTTSRLMYMYLTKAKKANSKLDLTFLPHIVTLDLGSIALILHSIISYMKFMDTLVR